MHSISIFANGSRRRADRRGGIIVLTALLITVMLAMIAFSVDIGFIMVARTELQRAADASAMAAAADLMDDRRLQGDAGLNAVDFSARSTAEEYAWANSIIGIHPEVDTNDENVADGDVVLGHFGTDRQLTTYGDQRMYNAASVRVQLTTTRNGRLPLFFARVLGIVSTDVAAEATASFSDGITGFRPSERTGNSKLIPFCVHVDGWNNLLAGNGADDMSFDNASETLASGSDGIKELKLWTGDSNAPGNFGSLTIGSGEGESQNATVQRQIREGVGELDLSDLGGELRLNPSTDSIDIPGDSGLTTGHANAAQDIIGKAVVMPIYEQTIASGNNTTYKVIGFAGVRIVEVQSTGSDKFIKIQPASVIDDSAISGGTGTSDFVYQPVMLVK